MKRQVFIILFLLVSYSATAQKQTITFKDLWIDWTFYPKTIEAVHSLNDDDYYTTLEYYSKIKKYNYLSGNAVSDVLLFSELETDLPYIRDYTFSNDEQKILFYGPVKPIYRHSFETNYYFYSVKKRKAYPLSGKGLQQLATFSAQNNFIAFVRDNNIFIKKIQDKKHSLDTTELQVTTDGEKNKIRNGIPDWVYEEEFEFIKAFEWSPGDKYLAYYKFDESNLKNYYIKKYNSFETPKDKKNNYPDLISYKYPKAGEDNSTVSIHIYNISTQKTIKVPIPNNENSYYIPRIKWSKNDNILTIMTLNRHQNNLKIIAYHIAENKIDTIYSEENKAYINESHFDNFQFLNDKKHFVITNETDGFSHIYLYKNNGELVRQITKGKWDVTEYIGYDAEKQFFYYQAAAESPLKREIYSVNINGKNNKKLSTLSGTNNAVFSKNFNYYINYYSNVLTPTYVTLHKANGDLLRTLEENKEIQRKLKHYVFSPKQFFQFKTTENVILNGWIVRPLDFDSLKKYPVLMIQYSGPNSQQVLDEWNVGWEQVLAANGYVVVCVDGRGTGARGEEFRKMTYLNLGKYETIDQIETAKYLANISYIDKDRIGIFGWSYGGFITTTCLTKAPDYFKAGIAVAPVTDWRYYDNIYTERFMRTPQENKQGYYDSSPINFVDKLNGNLLLIHGSADDNVHLQNTMEFAEALVQANKQFDMHIYTNKNHGIYGGNTRMHLYNKMLTFLLKNL